MDNQHPPDDRRTLSPLKMAGYAGLAVGAILLVCALVLLLFPDPCVNKFIKPRIAQAIAEAYPAYSIHIGDLSYNVLENRIACDSVALHAVDDSFTSSLGLFSVTGIDWIHILWRGASSPEDFARAELDAQDIAVRFPQSHYGLRCKQLRVSVPDSEIVVDALELHPSVDDELLFGWSKFRMTRFRLVVPHAGASGFAFLDLMQGKGYRARSATIQGALLDVLINKDKPCAADTSHIPMPHEILSSMQEVLQIDSLSIVNSRLNYGERFVLGERPALITLDSIQVLAAGIANHRDSGAVMTIHVQGWFMNAGTMNVLVVLPVASPAFSFQYSGSLGTMDLRALNAFLETAEQKRITGGLLQAATFEITVSSGRASGTVRALYRDLTLAVIDKHTRSQKGFSDRVVSFIANTFTIRGTNMPDKTGSTKLGHVKYLRRRNDPFFVFVWFALRSGVADLVGF